MELISRHVTIDGLSTHILEAGVGERTILFLHGFPDLAWKWEPYMRELGGSFRVMALDLWGYGDSEGGSPEGRHAHTMAARVQRLIAQELGGRAVVVAHDWGGVIAWHLASSFPDAVEALVIVNAPHPNTYAKLRASDPVQQRSARYIAKMCGSGGVEACMAKDFAFLKYGMFEDRVGLSQALKDRLVAAWSRPGAIAEMLALYAANLDAAGGFPTTSRTVEAPTLVFWGMKDHALAPSNLDGLEAFARRLQIVRIEDGDHWTDTTHRLQIVQAIRNMQGRGSDQAGDV